MIPLSGNARDIGSNYVSIINVLLCISRRSFQTRDIILNVRCHKHSMQSILRYKKAKIRKRHNQKKIPTPKTEVGKNQTNSQVLIP